MIKLDMIKLQIIEAAMADNREKLKNTCNSVSEIISLMNEENGLYEIGYELKQCFHSLEQDLYIFNQFTECLQQILPLYLKCEENITVFTEEVQITKNRENNFKQVEISEWIFHMLG